VSALPRSLPKGVQALAAIAAGDPRREGALLARAKTYRQAKPAPQDPYRNLKPLRRLTSLEQ
jgi:hypothetical protein